MFRCSLILTLCFSSFGMASSLEEDEKIKSSWFLSSYRSGKTLQDWIIKEQIIPAESDIKPAYQKIQISSRSTSIFIKKIDIYPYFQDEYRILIQMRRCIDIKEAAFDSFKVSGVNCFQGNQENGAEFLSLFCKKEYLPDILGDYILDTLNIDDFRLTEKTIVPFLQMKTSLDSSSQNFKRILRSLVKRIKDPCLQQQLTALVICNLKQNSLYGDILLTLCKQIKDPKVPLFNEIRKIESELFFFDETTKNNKSRALQSLFVTRNDDEALDMQKKMIEILYGNSRTSKGTLPRALQNVRVCPESTANLVLLISEQQEQIRLLQLKMAS